MGEMTLQEKLRQDILNILLKLSVKELEALKSRFEPTELIDEAIRLKKEVFHQQN